MMDDHATADRPEAPGRSGVRRMKHAALALTLALSLGGGMGTGLAAGGCGEVACGRYDLAFTWADGRPDTFAGLYVRVRVETRQDPAEPGRVLSDAGPAPFAQDGTLALVLPELAPGPSRVVVAEVRTGPLPNDPVAYYGRSEPFAVEAGVARTIPVALNLQAIPASRGAAGVVVLEHGAAPTGDAALVNTPEVVLRLKTDTGVSARLSADPTFPEDETTPVDLSDAPRGEDGLRQVEVPWDLDAGGEPCASNYCPRSVYVRFTDVEGYESLVAEARAVIDAVSPRLLSPGGVTVSPTLANAAAQLVVSLTFDEPLGDAPTLRLSGPDEPPFPFEQVFPAPGDPLGTTYTLRATLAAGVLAPGEHALAVAAVDRAGNPAGGGGAQVVEAGSFQVDPAPPALTLGELVTPPQAPPGFLNAATMAAAKAADAAEAAPSPAVSLTVSATEPLEAPPTVRMGTWAMPCEPAGGTSDTPTFACTRTLTGNEADGLYTVTVAVTDLAGNDGAATAEPPIVIDTTPPTPVQVVIGPDLLSPGRQALVQLGMSEPMAEDLSLSAGAPLDGADAVEMVAQSPAGGTWLVTAPERVDGALPTAWTEGPVVLQLSGADVAGNPVAPAAAQVGAVTLDGERPKLVSLGLTGEPFSLGGVPIWGFNAASSQAPQDAITAHFFSADPLLPSSVRATLGAYAADCVLADPPLALPDGSAPAVGGQAWACAFQPSGDEPDGVRVFAVEASDLAGNATELELKDEPVLFDTQAPHVLAGTEDVSLGPGVGNPLATQDLTAAGANTSVALRFGVSEPLAVAPMVRAVPSSGAGAPIALPCVLASGQTAFECGIQAGILPPSTEEQYVFEVTLTDKVDNAATSTLDPAAASLPVDTVAPPPPNVGTEGMVTLTRAPWGTVETGYQPYLTLRGEAEALPVDADLWVRALAGSDPGTAAEVGRTEVDAQGGFGQCPDPGCSGAVQARFGTFPLSAADLTEVWLQAVDGAGNTSPPVRVRDVTWVASMGGKIAGNTAVNPQRLDAYAQSPATPVAAPDKELTGTGTTRGRGRWTRLRTTPSFTPPTRDHANLGYDPYRDRLLLFSGDAARRDTWELASGAWTLRCDPTVQPCEAPESDELHDTRMTYDARHGELLYITEFSDALWGWDGERWTKRCGQDTGCSMPSPFAFNKDLAYDPVRGRVVALFTDVFDSGTVAAWTGTAWEPLCAEPAPNCGLPALPINGFPKLAYDTGRSKLVLYFADEGIAQTWELASQGSAPQWTLTCDGPSGGGSCSMPMDSAGSPTRAQSMVFDERAGEVVLLTRLFLTTWTYSGSGWVQRAEHGTFSYSGTARPTLYYDRAIGSVRAYLPNEATLWDWTGSGWRRACGPGGGCQAPTKRWGAAAATDGRSAAVLFGGREEGGGEAVLGDTWWFDGRSWVPQDNAVASGSQGPAPGAGGVMAFLPSSRQYLLVPPDAPQAGWASQTAVWVSSAQPGGAPTTWDEPCAAWGANLAAAALCHAQAPSPRAFATLRWDPLRKAAILLGGRVDGGAGADSLGCVGVSCEAWAWRAGHWQPAGDTALPRASGHASAWSPDGPAIWSYGGLEDTLAVPTRSASLSRLSVPEKGPATWALPCGFDCAPGVRVGAHLSYDPDRRALLLFGGYDSDPNNVLASPTVWEHRADADVFAPGTWTQDACPTDEGCESPTGRAYGVMEYLPDLHRHLLFGGTVQQGLWNTDTPDGDTWLYDAGASGRPAQVMTVAYVAAGGPLGKGCGTNPDACPLRGLAVRWAGGALGAASDGTPVAGARLKGWAGGGWMGLAARGGDEAGQTLDWETHDRDIIGSLLVPSRDGILHLLVEPRGANGDLPGFAELRTEALDVSVSYRLDGPAPVCGDGIVDPESGEACDLGAAANVGDYGGCAAGCQLAPRCGDGVVDDAQGEACDDGNALPGDGCDSACHWESAPCSPSTLTALPFAGSGEQTVEIAGDVTGAPDELQGSCLEPLLQAGSAERLYSLVAPADGTLSARLAGPGALDGALSVRQSCVDASTELACGTANGAQAGEPWVSIPVAAGEGLTLIVEGSSATAGLFELIVEFQPAPPAAPCADAQALTLTPGTPLVVSGTTEGAYDALAAPCADATSPERLFSFVAPKDGDVHARVVRAPGSTLDPVVWVMTDACAGNPWLWYSSPGYECDDDRHGRDAEAWWTVSAGETYYVGVEGFGDTQGPFDLILAHVPSSGGPDACAAPTAMTVGALGSTTVDGSTVSSFDESWGTLSAACSPMTRWSRVFEVAAPGDGALHAEVQGVGGFDPILFATEWLCGEPSTTTCQDDASPSDRGAALDVPVWSGEPVFFSVQGYGGQVGDFTLTVTHSAP